MLLAVSIVAVEKTKGGSNKEIKKMKKTDWIFFVVLSLLFAGCMKDKGVVSLKATFEDFVVRKSTSQKVYFEDHDGDLYCCWKPNSGDRVRVNGDNYYVSTTSLQGAKIENIESSSEYFALYPHNCIGEGVSVGRNNVIDIPVREEYRPITVGQRTQQLIFAPMAAYSTGREELCFKQTCGVMAFDIKGSGILDSIRVKSLSTPLAGSFNLTIGAGVPVISATANTQNMRVLAHINSPLAAATKRFYLPLPPTSLSGDQFTIEIFMQSADGNTRYRYIRNSASQNAMIDPCDVIETAELTLGRGSVLPSGWSLDSLVRGDSEDFPYILNSWPSSFVPGRYYRLANVAPLEGNGWVLVDNQHSISNFSAHLDGGGYTLHLLNTALFDTISGTASIKNMTIQNEVTRMGMYVDFGSLANTVASNAEVTIDNCQSKGAITALSSSAHVYLGGLVGNIKTGAHVTIRNSSNQSALDGKSITTQSIVGGLVGYSAGSSVLTVTNSYSFCDQRVTSDNANSSTFSGGLIGSTKGTIVLENSYGYITRVTGVRQGGLIGSVANPSSGSASITFENCFYYVDGLDVAAIGKLGDGVRAPSGTSYRLNGGRTYSGGSLAEALNGWVQSHGPNHTRWKNGTVQGVNAVVFVSQ